MFLVCPRDVAPTVPAPIQTATADDPKQKNVLVNKDQDLRVLLSAACEKYTLTHTYHIKSSDLLAHA